MTKNRFTLEMQYWKGNPQGRKLFDNVTGQEGMSVEELCNIASALHSKCEELESVLEVYEDSLNKLEEENKELKQEIKGFEGCSHNWGILYDEAKNKVEELSKKNQELKYHLNRTEKELKEYKDFMSLG